LAELKQLALSSLRANPFRDLATFPLREKRVAGLVESINAEGFWEGVLARPVRRGYEIAFGHHRVEAARKALGEHARVPIIVRDIDNEQMLRLMLRENSSENGRDFWSGFVEPVRAAVLGFRDGTVKALVKQGEASRPDMHRDAAGKHPFQISRGPQSATVPYNAWSISSTLNNLEEKGGVPKGVHLALEVLALLDEGHVSVRAIEGFAFEDVRKMVTEKRAQVRKRHAEIEARREAEEKRLAQEEEKHKRQAEADAERQKKEAKDAEERKRVAEEAARLRAIEDARLRREREERDARDQTEREWAAAEAAKEAAEKVARRKQAKESEVPQEDPAAPNLKPATRVLLDPSPYIARLRAVHVPNHLDALNFEDFDEFIDRLLDPAHACPDADVRYLADELKRFVKLSEHLLRFRKWSQLVRQAARKRDVKLED
jgi:flagellar biosynthesis GTPase FlhF